MRAAGISPRGNSPCPPHLYNKKFSDLSSHHTRMRCICTPVARQELLSPRGCFYMVAVEDNDPAQIVQAMRDQGVHAEVIGAQCLPLFFAVFCVCVLFFFYLHIFVWVCGCHFVVFFDRPSSARSAGSRPRGGDCNCNTACTFLYQCFVSFVYFWVFLCFGAFPCFVWRFPEFWCACAFVLFLCFFVFTFSGASLCEDSDPGQIVEVMRGQGVITRRCIL